MSFNYQARRVRDPGHPPWHRLSSLRACVRSYCVLTGAAYANLSTCLGVAFPYDPGRSPPTDAFLRRVLDEVERERNRYLERLRVFERKRSLTKAHGNRQLSTAERTLLREMRGRVG
jgi:hypothetical protein